MTHLVDTNVVSEQGRPAPEARVIAYLESLPPGAAYISAVTVAKAWAELSLDSEGDRPRDQDGGRPHRRHRKGPWPHDRHPEHEGLRWRRCRGRQSMGRTVPATSLTSEMDVHLMRGQDGRFVMTRYPVAS